jgi:glutamate--cysteine ligase
MINPFFSKCSGINFHERIGEECLQESVDAILKKIARKYKEYGIKEKPFVIVKADNSSSGMGIMTVRDIKDLPGLLEKTASTRQGSDPLQELILQEGILTHERINAAVAEPVVYMMDRYVVGGFYRVHADRGEDENLSAPGSSYVPLAFGSSAQLPQLGVRPGASEPNRFYMYGVIGRLAMLAASYELEATDPERDTYDE